MLMYILQNIYNPIRTIENKNNLPMSMYSDLKSKYNFSQALPQVRLCQT